MRSHLGIRWMSMIVSRIGCFTLLVGGSVCLQPVMEPRFFGRSARSLISTSARSISYRLEAWPLTVLYCPHFLYGPAQFVGQTINSLHQEQLTVVLRSHCCTAHCPCHIRDLLTSVRVL